MVYLSSMVRMWSPGFPCCCIDFPVPDSLKSGTFHKGNANCPSPASVVGQLSHATDVADHCAELRLLHPCGAVGGHHPHDWYADDSQDLRLRLDGADWLFRHEEGAEGLTGNHTSSE